MEWIHPNHADSDYLLRFHICDFNQSGNLKMVFDFNENTVGSNKLKSTSHHFKAIFNAFLKDFNHPIVKPNMITERETIIFKSPIETS